MVGLAEVLVAKENHAMIGIGLLDRIHLAARDLSQVDIRYLCAHAGQHFNLHCVSPIRASFSRSREITLAQKFRVAMPAILTHIRPDRAAGRHIHAGRHRGGWHGSAREMRRDLPRDVRAGRHVDGTGAPHLRGNPLRQRTKIGIGPGDRLRRCARVRREIDQH
jgi:hypothetical protein